MVSSHLPMRWRAESAAQPPFGNPKHEPSATSPACWHLRAVRTCAFQSPVRHPCFCRHCLSHLLNFLGKTQRNRGNDHVRPGQEKGLYSREAQPAVPGKGWVFGLSRKSPPAGPGGALCRALLAPALFPKVQDHLLHSADLCSQVRQLIPQLLHLLGLLPQHRERVPAVTRKADLVRELPSPSRSLQAQERAWSKRPRQERKARALGAGQGSANSTATPAAPPPNVLRVRREERALTAWTSARLQAAPAAPERERLSV